MWRFSNHFRYGCGYDELHEDYKVDVINVICDYPQYSKIRIYSLKKDCWRTVKDYQGFLMDCSAKFVNGKLYWCSSATEKVGQYKDCNIISLDLTYEIWGKVEQPNYGQQCKLFSLKLGVLRSNLFVLCTYNKGAHFDVWVMKEDYYGVKASWTKMLTINYPYVRYQPFCVSNKGEILLLFKLFFMIYNLKDDSTRQL
ncbi:F-box/kelch-repeat protein At3g23880-like [Nicotiana tomentosiformis]|uniref:F-box/kelch-repeat protein At3g23880-like n=1 Tax=Nicotiana tomentosiformis TaxID=4098 RepID=UPI00388C53CE